jgi:WD40 repeat protein
MKKSISSSSRKQKDKLTLEKILGLTSLNNATFVATGTGNIIYCAGSVAILYNPDTNKQISFFRVNKPIASMCVSSDGVYLAIGERGHQPSVTVWDIDTGIKLTTLNGHQHGIGCMSFSTLGNLLVTVGFRHDKQLMLWDWSSEKVIAKHKLENKVNAISFHQSSAFFVTCGDRHLKWWYIMKGSNGDVENLVGKPASILESQKHFNFIDVNCGMGENKSSIYCVTTSGVLCMVHETRLMDKWVQLESPSSYSLSLTSSHIFVGCAVGITRVFSASNLEYIATLPLPSISGRKDTTLPACYAIQVIPTTHYIAILYADRSFYIWENTGNFESAVKLRSFSFHRACIWDIQFIEHQPFVFDSNEHQETITPVMPLGTFVTCSADNSLCFWNLDASQQRKSIWKSGHSRELLHCLDLNQFENDDIPLDDSLIHSDQEVDISNYDGTTNIGYGFQDPELPERQQVEKYNLRNYCKSLIDCFI